MAHPPFEAAYHGRPAGHKKHGNGMSPLVGPVYLENQNRSGDYAQSMPDRLLNWEFARKNRG